MARIRVMVADDDPILCATLEQQLKEDVHFEVLTSAHDGEDALLKIALHHPQLVILDVMLPLVDGLSILEKIRDSKDQKPKVVVYSSIGADHITQYAMSLGAIAYFLKPMPLDTLVRRVYMLFCDPVQGISAAGSVSEAEDTHPFDAEIIDLLHRMAVPPHIKGYRYLIEAIHLVIRNMNRINAMTYEIYPQVAKMYDTTPSRVERSMRHAIECAWNRCRVETIEDIFGYTLDEEKDRPANSEFIAMLADHVRVQKRKV